MAGTRLKPRKPLPATKLLARAGGSVASGPICHERIPKFHLLLLVLRLLWSLTVMEHHLNRQLKRTDSL